VTARLDGRVVLITGTAGGQGAVAARLFAEAGATVVGCDVKRGPGVAQVDLTDEDAVRRWVDSAVDEHGRIDVLYANAGTTRFNPVEDVSAGEWECRGGGAVRALRGLGRRVVRHGCEPRRGWRLVGSAAGRGTTESGDSMTMKTGTMATDRPERYAKQLLSHWAQRGTVTEEHGSSVMRWTTGQVIELRPVDGALEVSVSVPEDGDVDRFATVVAEHLQRFGQRDELEVVWR